MHGTCTSPPTGSQVSPRLCSSAISAAFSICSGVPPSTAVAPAAAIAQAAPTSPWQPASAPEIDAFAAMSDPMAVAVRKYSATRSPPRCISTAGTMPGGAVRRRGHDALPGGVLLVHREGVGVQPLLGVERHLLRSPAAAAAPTRDAARRAVRAARPPPAMPPSMQPRIAAQIASIPVSASCRGPNASSFARAISAIDSPCSWHRREQLRGGGVVVNGSATVRMGDDVLALDEAAADRVEGLRPDLLPPSASTAVNRMPLVCRSSRVSGASSTSRCASTTGCVPPSSTTPPSASAAQPPGSTAGSQVSGSYPASPATIAPGVPWPTPVAPSEP